jgi:hypothetical protein
MDRKAALAVRDKLRGELSGMRSTGTPASALPSLGIFVAHDEKLLKSWGDRYGLSILIPEGEEKRLSGWTRHAVDAADGEADVAAFTPFRAYSCLSATHLAPGCSISSGDGVFAGTLGAFVRRGSTPAVLSNTHVLAPELTGSEGNVVYHPGLLDQPPESAAIGTLLDFAALAADGAENHVDAAIASYDPNKITIECPRPGQPGFVRGATDDPDPDELQEKIGRTTGVTQGQLTRFGHLSWVDYGELGMMLFRDCLVVESEDAPFSKPGDSGSLIYGSGSRLASALLFAGADSGGLYQTGMTLANPIMNVLDALHVDLAPEGGAQ